MGKRDDFWGRVPEDEDGQIRWPESASKRTALVREAFGATVIGALETVLKEKFEIVEGKPPAPGSNDYLVEAARRETFSRMSDVERAEVRRLVKSACFSTLYWILVTLEHFPQANVDFTVQPLSPQGEPFPPIGIEETELHHLYFEWIDRFSDHGDR